MPLSPKAAILDALPATRLRELADVFGISGPRQAKADLVEAFTRNRRLSAERMLGELQRDELKQICRNQGLDDSGREKQALIDRICDTQAKPKRKATTPKASSAPSTQERASAMPATTTTDEKPAKRGRKKAAKPAENKSFEETLWDTATKLRGSVQSAEYKHVVLSLIFLKFISDTFEARRQALIDQGKEQYCDMVEFYTMENVFYLDEEARWSYIQTAAKSQQGKLALIIDAALKSVETKNKALKDALPNNYFTGLGLDPSKLASLVDAVSDISTTTESEEDVVGRVYEYFLGRFAASEGQRGGEFYTPKCVVNLIAEMIEPYKGKIYDPCCGSGGMFVQSLEFVKSHQGNRKDISIYGQEMTKTTHKLARMNLAIRGMSANLGEVPADTFFKDQHPDLKADYIMANPPFNLKDWRKDTELTKDPRWNGYLTPPTGNANYAWILHMVSKLSEHGTAGFVLANGSMSTTSGGEGEIRQKLIENDLIDCMVALPGQLFYTTQIPVCLWFISKNKKADPERGHRDRQHETLFIDARSCGSLIEGSRKQKELSSGEDSEIRRIAKLYHAWRGEAKDGDYEDQPGFCKSASQSDIVKNDYVLTPGRYVGVADEVDDGIAFEDKMSSLVNSLHSNMDHAMELDRKLRHVISELGYGK